MITVLLVEQDPSLQEEYLSILHDLDLNTELCNRVGKAVERLRCFTYDALIVDFGVKVLNPKEVIKVLRKLSPKVPIIALTDKKGSIEKEMVEEGVFSCLVKPLKEKELLHVIGNAVNKKESVH